MQVVAADVIVIPRSPFLLHPIGDSRALVHFPDLVDHAGVKENALGNRCFTGVDMRRDPDVPRPFQRKLAIRRVWIFRRGVYLSIVAVAIIVTT